ncbi:MAG: hypothetical protein ABW328_04055 [Ilumatobacteraceae bacterium]
MLLAAVAALLGGLVAPAPAAADALASETMVESQVVAPTPSRLASSSSWRSVRPVDRAAGARPVAGTFTRSAIERLDAVDTPVTDAPPPGRAPPRC